MVIRTPDQRVRVFVSSTLEELAQERQAARQAIETLRLSPILFELGARPHPPRDLYSAYLEQSQVFIGIYWQRYGWIAPGMEVSGLEDEYLQATSKPKLLYVKRPAPEREEGLDRLLERIESEGELSYQQFENRDELKTLIEGDLSMLLSEQFRLAQEGAAEEDESQAVRTDLPFSSDGFVGRADELATLEEHLFAHSIRLVTLTGPGGVGKTRLSLELAHRLADRYRDGAAFVPLGAVFDPTLVVPTLIQSLNVQGSGAEPLELLVEHLRPRNLLVVLDNFEQVVAASPDIAHILESCPEVTMIVTSREILHVRSEVEFPLDPLAVPERWSNLNLLKRNDAVQLFVQRASAVDPHFELTPKNAETIAAICRRLDGLPLAVELAAARIRLLSLDSMLDRLGSSLSVLKGGPRDSPERHQTLRSAIEWSVGLLTPEEKTFFTRLGVFSGGWSLEAVEEIVCGVESRDTLDLMTSLLEKSLIKSEESSAEPRFSMLQTIAEYACDLLKSSEEVEDLGREHAEYFLQLIAASHQGLRSASQSSWMERLESDNENLRVAMRWLLENDRADEVAEAGWTIWLFWWINAHLQEARDLAKDMLESSSLSEAARSKALAIYGVMAFWQTDYAVGIPKLAEALVMMRDLGDRAGVALCQLPLGFVEAATGDPKQAQERYLESIKYFKETGDEWGTAIALNAYTWMTIGVDMDIGEEPFNESVELSRRLGTQFEYGMALRNLGGYRARRGKTDSAKELLGEALRTLWHGSSRGGASYTVDAIAEIAADTGDAGTAAQLLAATTATRETIGSSIIPMFAPRFERYVEQVRKELGEERFAKEWAVGRELGMRGGVELALDWLEQTAAGSSKTKG